MLYHLRHDHHPSHAPITPFRSPFLATHPPSNPHPTLPSTHLTPHVLPRHHRLVLRDVPVLDQLHVREKHRYACNSLLLSISSPVWLALLHCSLLLSVCLASLLHSLPALMSRFMHCMNSHPSSTPHHSPTSHPHTHPPTHPHTHPPSVTVAVWQQWAARTPSWAAGATWGAASRRCSWEGPYSPCSRYTRPLSHHIMAWPLPRPVLLCTTHSF